MYQKRNREGCKYSRFNAVGNPNTDCLMVCPDGYLRLIEPFEVEIQTRDRMKGHLQYSSMIRERLTELSLLELSNTGQIGTTPFVHLC